MTLLTAGGPRNTDSRRVCRGRTPSRQSTQIGNVLQRHLFRRHQCVRPHGRPSFVPAWRCWRGPDFFTTEVLTLRGLVTYQVLFFIHLESRQVEIAGITIRPDQPWMKQMARNVTMEGSGILQDCRYLLHDRNTKYTRSCGAIIASGQAEPLALPARCPNMNAHAERWVRSVKEECLSNVILLGERSLRRALNEYVEHCHAHQGKGNVLLFPRDANIRRERQPVQCRERLGGLLRYCHQEAG
jgi:putative transposase